MGLILAVTYRALGALVPFAIGAIVSYAVAPLVDHLVALIPFDQPKHETWRRGTAVLVIYLVFFGSIAAVGIVLIPLAAEQIVHFVDDRPALTDAARQQLVGLLQQYQQQTPVEIQMRLTDMAQQVSSTAAVIAGSVLAATVNTVSTTVSVVVGVAIVPFWMFYAMRDRHAVGRNIRRAAPAEAREDVGMILALSDLLLGRYIRAQLLLGLVVGAAVTIAMSLLGVELSVGLGVWAGITELIPIVGPWLGAIPGLVIVAATNPELLPWVVLVYFAVQLLENNLLVPRVQGEALDMHPAVVVLLLVVGGAVWGFVGLVVIIPAAAILREWFWYADRRLRGQSPQEAFGAGHLAHGNHPAETDAEGETNGETNSPVAPPTPTDAAR